MKIKKATKITTIRTDFDRGGFIELRKDEDFGRLFIPACLNKGDYDYSNWHLNDLKDLADAIYATLKERGYIS